MASITNINGRWILSDTINDKIVVQTYDGVSKTSAIKKFKILCKIIKYERKYFT